MKLPNSDQAILYEIQKRMTQINIHLVSQSPSLRVSHL